MRNNKYKLGLVVLLSILFVSGCADRDKSAGPGLTPPTVTSVSPPNGTSVGCGTTVVNATFSESMNSSTINATTFTLAGSHGVTVAGQVSYSPSNNTASFTLSAPLAQNTTYTGTITTGAKDLYGNALAANYVWSFTMTACAPVIVPTVVSVGPVNGSITACAGTIVIATFSEAMNPATINTSTFTVMGPNSAGVTGQVTYNATSNVATFTPSAALTVGTQYTATITT
ncbi:MAG: Ig-like domain-containing protein, partial [Acidobacteriaceae bacterium]